MAMGMADVHLGKTLQVAFYKLEPTNSLVVKLYLLTSVVFLGLITPGIWESQLEVKLCTSAELKLIY